ncbi:MAG: hypothetical protein E7418_03910 [Ruminococcaceae bacterium]|nr:hypothetical protein [Oscillospiraceae bacterium]
MKKIIAIVLTVLMVFSTMAVSAHPFSDVASHWAEGEIEKAYTNGIVQGDGNGLFRPNDTVSRAEFLKMVTVLTSAVLGVEIPQIENVEHWGIPYNYVACSTYLIPAEELSYDGVIPGGLLAKDCDDPIRRWEMAFIISSFFKNVVGITANGAGTLADYAEVQATYDAVIVESIGSLVGMGISVGDENRCFNAGSTGTRAEAVTFINRMADEIMDIVHMQEEMMAERIKAYTEIPEGHPVVEFEMTNGKKFEVTLYPEYAPQTCANFLDLVKSGFYNGLTFHRVVSGFVAQGGDPEGNGSGDAGYNIVGEFAANGFEQNMIPHEQGVLSMARADHPNSASCQFFICLDRASSLDGLYAAFGEVTKGMEVVLSFTEGEMTAAQNGEPSVPVVPIVIKKATVKQ